MAKKKHTERRHGTDIQKLDDTEYIGCVSTKCTKAEPPLYRVRRDGKTRVLCREHALDFGDLDEEDLDSDDPADDQKDERQGVVA